MESIKQLLITLATELQEIAENTEDIETRNKLNELIDRIWVRIDL